MSALYQRRHYDQLAGLLADLRREACGDRFTLVALDKLTSRLSDVFEEDNPRFDRGRFVSACLASHSPALTDGQDFTV